MKGKYPDITAYHRRDSFPSPPLRWTGVVGRGREGFEPPIRKPAPLCRADSSSESFSWEWTRGETHGRAPEEDLRRRTQGWDLIGPGGDTGTGYSGGDPGSGPNGDLRRAPKEMTP